LDHRAFAEPESASQIHWGALFRLGGAIFYFTIRGMMLP
jgi:hypothetical protein